MWALAESNTRSVDDEAELVVVALDQFRQHLGHHLQQIALFSLPQQHQADDTGSKDAAPTDDADSTPQSWKWERQDFGRGWSLVFSKRATLTALASFLDLYISRRRHQESLSSDLFEVGMDEMPDHLKRVEDGWSIVYKSNEWLALEVNLTHTIPQGMPTLDLRFSLDGQYIANASFGAVNVFDVSTGALSHTLMLPSEEAIVYAVWFSPDGDRIVAGDNESFVTVSEASTPESGS
jgi:WD40 repeat protein